MRGGEVFPGGSPGVGQSWVPSALPDSSMHAPQFLGYLQPRGPLHPPRRPHGGQPAPLFPPCHCPLGPCTPELLPFPGDGGHIFPVSVLAWFPDVPLGRVALRRLGEQVHIEWPGRRAGLALLA